MVKRYSSKTRQEVLTRLGAGEGPAQIAKTLQIPAGTIRSWKWKVEHPGAQGRRNEWRRGNYKRHGSRLPEQRRALITSTYLAGASVNRIAEQLGHSSCTISRILGENGILACQYRRYKVDERFFSSIDSEEKAYWLGFLYADGAIVGNAIELQLSERDKAHIDGFRKALQSSHPIRLKNNGASPNRLACIKIGSKEMVSDLGRFGLVPNKTFIITPPKCGPIIDYLLRHFWRGLFDGDGSIYFTTRKCSDWKRWRLELSGTKEMAQGFLDFILSRGIETTAQPRLHRNTYRITFGGNFLAKQIVRLLYGGARIYLDRKWKLANRLLGA